MKRSDFLGRCLDLLGTPYHHQGRKPGLGIDCVGVPIVAAQQCGVSLPSPADYERVPSELEGHMIAHCGDPIDWDDRQPGDLVMFWYSTRRRPQHVAVLDQDEHGDDFIIHAHASRRNVVRDRLCSFWRPRIVAVFRLPNLDD